MVVFTTPPAKDVTVEETMTRLVSRQASGSSKSVWKPLGKWILLWLSDFPVRTDTVVYIETLAIDSFVMNPHTSGHRQVWNVS